MNGSFPRAVAFAALMACATVMAWAFTPTHYLADDKPPVSLETMFPSHFGEWEIDTSIIPLQPLPELQRTIEATYDQTLSRTYRDAAGHQVMVSIAYGRNQNRGMNTHRPDVCYPAQGLPIKQGNRPGVVEFAHTAIPVTRLVATRGNRDEPITYWLIVGDEITGFGWNYKVQTFQHGVRGNIPDGMLLRFSTVERDDHEGFQRQEQFISSLLTNMDTAARRQVLGRLTPAA